MNNIINEIVTVRSRVSERDVKVIYLAAICDIGLAAIAIAGLVFLICF